jgi:hypothetical protein
LARGTLVYGLTAGEMARYIHAAHHDRGPLTVVPMTGWTRDMTWSQTGRPLDSSLAQPEIPGRGSALSRDRPLGRYDSIGGTWHLGSMPHCGCPLVGSRPAVRCAES